MVALFFQKVLEIRQLSEQNKQINNNSYNNNLLNNQNNNNININPSYILQQQSFQNCFPNLINNNLNPNLTQLNNLDLNKKEERFFMIQKNTYYYNLIILNLFSKN